MLGPATEGRARSRSERTHRGEGRCGVVRKLEAPIRKLMRCNVPGHRQASPRLASFALALIGSTLGTSLKYYFTSVLNRNRQQQILHYGNIEQLSLVERPLCASHLPVITRYGDVNSNLLSLQHRDIVSHEKQTLFERRNYRHRKCRYCRWIPYPNVPN
jgi:hypothetical protein